VNLHELERWIAQRVEDFLFRIRVPEIIGYPLGVVAIFSPRVRSWLCKGRS
jgi:hypothetical protein